MAASPEQVTHGFTLSSPHWAWLILNGYKTIENRQVRFARGWYAVQVGAAAYTTIGEELKYRQEFKMPSVLTMKKGVVHGLCKIEAGIPYEHCKKSRWAVSEYKICNVITEIIPFDEGETVPARGQLGTWPLKESEEHVRYLAKQAIALGHRKRNTNAEKEFGHLLDAHREAATQGKGKRPAEEAAEAKSKPSATLKKAKCETGKASEHEKESEPVKAPKTDIRSFFKK